MKNKTSITHKLCISFYAVLAVCIFCAESKAQKEVSVFNLIGKKNDTVQVMTLNDLFEYQKECYSDSTTYCYRIMCDWDCIELVCDCENKGNRDPFIGECKTRYIHKQATLEGFVMWLRKKYYR